MTENFKITERDKKLLRLLHQFSLMSTRQIARTVFYGVAMTTVLRRLRKLQELALIQFIEYQKGRERAWVMTRNGAWEVNLEIPKKNYSLNMIDHDVKLVELRILMTGHGFVKNWIAEHEIRAKVISERGFRDAQKRIVPDGLMTIEKDGINQAIAIELELHFKNEARYVETFRSYHKKSKVNFVWYVVSSIGLGKHLEKLWKRETFYQGGPEFIWSVFSDVVKNELKAKVIRGNKSYELELFFGKRSSPEVAQAMSIESEQAKVSVVNTRIENHTQNLAAEI